MTDDIELITYSKKGNVRQLTEVLAKRNCSKKAIDDAIRICIIRYSFLDQKFAKCIQELIKYADLNYISIHEHSTLLMSFCAKGDSSLLKEFLPQPNPLHNSTKINIFPHVPNKSTFLHHILDATLEGNALEILNMIIDYTGNDKAIIQKVFLEENIKGENPLSLIISKGWYQMLLLYFEYNKYYKFVLKESLNNLVHCAVKGKNLKCLRRILIESSREELKEKNKEGLTPLELAKSLKLNFFAKLIMSHEDNSSLSSIFKARLSQDSFTSNDILLIYQEKQYEEVSMYLNLYQLYGSLIDDKSYLNLSLEWNNLLLNYHLSSSLNNTTAEKNTNGLKRERILSQFLDKNKNSKSPQRITLIDLSKFLSKYINPLSITDHIDEESNAIDMLLYNKGILSICLGDNTSALKIFELYLRHIYPQHNDLYYKWIMYVNITLFLLDYFIKINQPNITSVILITFEKYLFTNYKCQSNLNVSKETELVFNYLTNNEIFNQQSPTWDELFGIINLFKALHDIDNGKKHIAEYKKLIENCNYTPEMKIFQRLNAIYICTKIKMNYHYNFLSKCFKKITMIKTIDFDYSDEYKLFYFNSLGIVNLKLKNYCNAEFYFRNGISTYKQLVTMSNNKKFNGLNLQASYLCYIKFNLALSLFYQKKFKQTQAILQEMTEVNILNKNIYVWYRLGLSSLEIYLSERKRENCWKADSDVISRTVGYQPNKIPSEDKNIQANPQSNSGNENDTKKGKDDKKNEKPNEEDENYDELYDQFEKEYGNQSIDSAPPESDISNGGDKRRIILTAQKDKRNETTNILLKKELTTALNSFRQVILLSKQEVKDNQIIKDIYFHYAKSHEGFGLDKAFNQNIIMSSYLNLLFCMSLKEMWSEMLYLIKCLQLKQKTLSNDIKLKLAHYQIEALFALNKYKEAKDALQECLTKYQLENFRLDYLTKQTGSVSNDIQFKINLNLSLARVHILNKNIDEAKKTLKNTIDVFYKGKIEDLPGFAMNMVLFLYLSDEKTDMPLVINLIKKRKFDLSKWK